MLAAAGFGTCWIFAGAARPGEFTRIGLAAGFAGAAVHMLVDFDFWDPAFRHYFFLSLAALALTARLDPPGFAKVAVPAIAAAVLFAIAIPLGAAVAPRFLEAEELASSASASEARNRDEEADSNLEAAAAANRLDPDPVVRRGLREFQRWQRLVAERGPVEGTTRADLAITILEDALRRRPRWTPIEARLAEVHEAVARLLRERGGAAGSIEAATAEAHLQEAERHARGAVEFYPTRAYHQYLLGRILDAEGNADEAASAYREALRLSSLARRVPRLALDGVHAALAASRTGADPASVAAALREWLRAQEQRPVLAARWRARLPFLTPEEKAIVDAAGNSK